MKTAKIIICLLLISVCFRGIWLFSTIERDEGINSYISWKMSEGKKLYTDLLTNKPPMIYIMSMYIIRFFGNSIIPLRLFNNLMFLFSVVILYFLVQKLYSKKISIYSSLCYIVFMNLPVFEGQLVMTESFVNYFTIFSMWFLVNYKENKKSIFFVLSMLAMLIAASFKLNALAGFAILILIYFKITKLDKKNIFKIFSILILMSLLTEIVLRILTSNGLIYFIRYMATELFYAYNLNNSIFTSYNIEYLKLIVLEAGILLLFIIIFFIDYFRKIKDSLIVYWFLIMLPVTIIPPAFGHYFIMIIAPAAILSGLGMELFFNKKYIFAKQAIVLILIAVSVYYSAMQFPNFNIKTNFVDFKYSDFSSYDEQIQISKFVKNVTGPNDRVGVYGFSSEIYFLSSRDPQNMYYSGFTCEQQTLKFGENSNITMEETPQSLIKSQMEGDRRATLQLTIENLENIIYYKAMEPKAFIFVKDYDLKCENRFEREILSDVRNKWQKKEFPSAFVYYP